MRKTMLKRALLALMLAATLLCLCSCHGKDAGAGFTIPNGLDESKTYEISFWAKNDTNKTQTEIYNKAIEDFQKLYPNIHVNIRLYTDYGRIYNDVITNIATDTTPNVCITYPDHIATYMTGQNVIVPLDALMDDPAYGLGGSEVRFDSPRRDEVIPEFLQECVIGGQTCAIPYMRSTEACYINKTYVEKLGYTVPDVLTWDFVWEVSEAAMAQDAAGNFAVNGQKVMIPFIYKSTDNMMITLLKQQGAAYSTDAGEILIFNDTTAEDLKEIYKHGKSRAFSTFKISSYPANFLNAGQCIFAIDSTAGATWMGSEAPLLDISEDQLVPFETVVRPVPQVGTEGLKMISQGPSICVFGKEDPQEVLASWLFAQYMLTDGVQIAYAQTEGYVPVTSKAQATPEYIQYLADEGMDNDLHYPVKLQATKLLLEHTADTFVTPVFNGSTSLRNAAGQLIEEAVKSARRKQTLDTEALFDDMRALYRLDSVTGNEEEIGPLPSEAIALIVTVIVIWVLMIAWRIADKIRGRKATAK